MASFSRLTLDEMIARVCRVLREKDAPVTPPYSLILGAGASAGVVPMTRQLVNDCIPDWLLQLDEDNLPKALRSRMHPTEDEARLKARAQHFWREFHSRNRDRRDAYAESIADFELDADGLPKDAGAAYRAVFNREALGGFEDLARMRRFFRQLTMGTDGKVKLNGTHFYLASLLALQPRGNTPPEPSERYKARRPFARTILTTNFDPLLQVSLQLVSLLYYTIDQPDLLQLDLAGEADHSAIQLVHVHGSIHRPFLANTKVELDSMRDRHAASLAGFLGQHGVIVIGSGGWEDCLTAALQRCQRFPHGLYWLGRDEAALPPAIVKFLEQHAGDAFFVQINDASDFMARLYSALAPGLHLPELLVEPLELLRREMLKIDLTNAAPLPKASSARDLTGGAAFGADLTPAEILRKNLELLKEAHERYFARKSDSDVQAQATEARVAAAAPNGLPPEAVAQILRQADLRFSENNHAVALGLYDALIESKALEGTDLALALFRRGYCHGDAGVYAKAIVDYTSLLATPNISPGLRANALVNRSHNYSEIQETTKAIADCTTVINMPDAPYEQRAQAFYNRGVCNQRMGERAKAIADYTSVLDLVDISPALRAVALVNRGIIHRQEGRAEDACRDFNVALATPDIAEDVAEKARANLAVLASESPASFVPPSQKPQPGSASPPKHAVKQAAAKTRKRRAP